MRDRSRAMVFLQPLRKDERCAPSRENAHADPEENELLCRVGARADGPDAAPLLAAGVRERRSRGRRRAGASACSARTWSRFAIPRAGSGCSTRTARTAARRSCWRATRSAACAASTTAGRWTSTASVLETPPEPDELDFRDKVRATAYPVHEAGGIVWTYMGPPGTEPPQLDFEFTDAARHDTVLIMTARRECNWAQCARRRDRLGPLATTCTRTRSSRSSPGATVYQRRATKPRLRSALERRRAEDRGAEYAVRLPLRRDPQSDRRSRQAKRYVRVTLFVAPLLRDLPGDPTAGATCRCSSRWTTSTRCSTTFKSAQRRRSTPKRARTHDSGSGTARGVDAR